MTTTSLAPAAALPVVQVISMLETTTTEPHDTPAMVTVVPTAKFVPAIVTAVPPAIGPLVGLIDDTTGEGPRRTGVFAVYGNAEGDNPIVVVFPVPSPPRPPYPQHRSRPVERIEHVPSYDVASANIATPLSVAGLVAGTSPTE